MALIECPKCGKQISDLANVCVSCGYQLKKPEKTTVENPAPENCDSTATGPAAPFPSGGNSSANRKKWTIIGIAVAVVAAIALLLILTLPGDRETNPPASAPENTESATATPEPPATETPAPVTAAPEMPVPETPVPETTVSENTVLVNNVLENSIPENTVPESSAVTETVSEPSVPENTVSEAPVPETAPSSETPASDSSSFVLFTVIDSVASGFSSMFGSSGD